MPGIYYKLELFEDPMHLQIVNFKLNGISRTEYDAILADVSSVFPTIPGLKAKYFLADDEGNTYGGVYIWESQQAMQDYQSGEIFKGIQALRATPACCARRCQRHMHRMHVACAAVTA